MITRRHLIGSLAAATIASPALARPSQVFAKDGYAVSGYDPVSYFSQSQPVQGLQAHRLMWQQVVWQFESAANLAVFERDPYAFAPQYGGYCAMSLTGGQLVESTPDAWAMYDGKLYLTRSIAARDRWLRDPDGHIAQASLHWPTLIAR